MQDRITLDEIAEMAGASRRHIADLKREDPNFPRELPTLGRKFLYRRDDVVRWLDGRAKALATARANGVDAFVAGLGAATVAAS